ncbi:transposable element Tc1 transposase [Trichonephila clavipes]|nr:transposable element Tc1 transposase [Trichonephila clavipes]
MATGSFMTHIIILVLKESEVPRDLHRRNGECLSSIKHVVGTTSGGFTQGQIIGTLEEGRSVTNVAAEFGIAHSIVSRLWRQFQTTGTAIRGSVVVVHEEPHPQMNGTLSYKPEETGGRQREKSLDTRHKRLDDRYRILPWPEDCTVVVCLHDALYVCTFNACPSEKAFSVVPGTPELEDNKWGRVLFTDESRFSLSSDSHRILIWRERGKPQSSLEHH